MTDWSFDFDYNMPIERSDNAQMSVTNYDEEAQYKYHYQLKGNETTKTIAPYSELSITYKVNQKLNINDTPQNYNFAYQKVNPSIEIILNEVGLENKGNDYFVETGVFKDISGMIHSQFPIKKIEYSITSGGLNMDMGVLDASEEWYIADPVLFAGVNQLTVTVTDTSGFMLAKSFILHMGSIKGDPQLDKNDNDGDGLQNWEETMYGTDPDNADTDGDGLSDFAELTSTGTNPLLSDTDENGITDDLEDDDDDGLTNMEEIDLGTDPASKDSDKDGLDDKEEQQYQTSPIDSDTDKDGLPDGREIILGTDPLNPDTDGNGIPDGEEEIKVGVEVTEKEKDPFVTPYLEVVLPAGISDTVEIKRDDPENSVWVPEDVPGLMGAAYDFSAEDEIKEAEIAFKFDRKFLDNENFNPQIYYIDTEKQEMYPLEDQEVDLDNCVVKARTAHFSKYALIDTYLWDQAWKDDIIAGEQDKLNARIDVAFVLDESGSMASNDRRNVRVQVSKNFIDILRNEENVHDRGAVIGFASSARLLSPFTNDHEALKKALDNIRASGGTSLSAGISLALGQFPLPSVDLPDTDDNYETSMKIIVMLTDGAGSYSDTYTQNAIEKGVKIYTVGLGSSYDRTLLQKIAEQTGAQSYHAENADDLIGEFEKLMSESVDIVTDSDGDGLSDYHEERIRLFNGLTIQLDPNDPDCDGDGLKDGEEIVQATDMWGRVFFRMKSHPNMTDSDGDGIPDNKDANPMQSDRETITLKRAEFVHIDNDPEGDGYGGNQGTFSTDDYWSLDSILSRYGCGNIAGSNVILYWALQNPGNANAITDIAIKDGRIELEDFKSFSRHMHKTHYFPVARGIGMFGPQVSNGLNKYGIAHTEEKYASSWSAFWDEDETLRDIRDMLEQDIPVVMAIGISNSGELKLYREANNQYIYKDESTSLHFVTITGLYMDKSRANHKIMLEVSSWGEKYFIDYEEYADFCDHFFGVFSNGIVNIQA